MPTLPGFGGRLGRLGFLGRLLLLTIMFGVVVAVLVVGLFPRGGGAPGRTGLLLVMAFTLPIFLYGSLALQVRRVRDIGWSPTMVVGGWFAFAIVDALIGHLFPALSAVGGGTVFGKLVNVALGFALLLWPGRPADDGPSTPYVHREYDRPRITTRQRALPGEPAAPVRQAPASSGGFGRRGIV